MALAAAAHTHAPERAKALDTLDDLVALGNTGLNQYARLKNHGIKEENLRRLLGPIGYSTSDLPAALVANLNSFGGTRGEYAHQSGTSRSLVDPKSEHDTVMSIYSDLVHADKLLRT